MKFTFGFRKVASDILTAFKSLEHSKHLEHLKSHLEFFKRVVKFRLFRKFKLFKKNAIVANDRIYINNIFTIKSTSTFSVIVACAIFSIGTTNLNLNAQSRGMSFNCEPCEFYDSYSLSCYPKPFRVSVSGATEATVKCSYDYTARPTGGSGDYTYVWTGSASSGGSSGGETKTFRAVEEGAQWVEVEVTDEDGCVKTERVDVAVKKEIEYTENFSNDVDGQWKSVKKHTCTKSNAERMDSGMCEGSLSGSKSISYTVGGEITGGVDKGKAEAAIGISGSRTVSDTVSGDQDYRMNPGERATLYVTKTRTHRSGDVTQNMCDGSTKTGTWEEYHSPVDNSKIEIR